MSEKEEKNWVDDRLTFIVLRDADLQLVTNGVQNEIAAHRLVLELSHGENAVAHNQVTLEN
jgi:hypothetical protein